MIPVIFENIPEPSVALGLINEAYSSPMVAVDTETNGQDIRDGRGFGMGISVAYRRNREPVAFYLPFRHRSGPNLDFRQFQEPLNKLLRKPVIYHNARFDLDSLETFGLTPGDNFYCTMILQHLLDENRFSYNLDFLDKTLLKGPGKNKSEELKQVIKTFGWGGVDSELMALYGATDAEVTLRLGEYTIPLAIKEGLSQVWKHKKRLIHVLRRMERNGVRINTGLCDEYIIRGELEMDLLIDRLDGLNPASPKDIEQLLIGELGLPPIYKKRKNGAVTLTFDKDAMARYDELLSYSDNPIAKWILEYRGWQKSVSSNYKAYLRLLSPDGRLRPNYKMHGTHTGRLSCSDPNLQQIPRKGDKPWNGEMKKAFIPTDDDHGLFEADYSQLELRLATAYGKVKSLMEVFEDGRDIFTEMASEMGFKRQDTKTLVYSMQYGAGLDRLSQVFGVSKSRASQIRDTYYESYPEFRALAKKASYKVLTTGKVDLWSGRFRHFLYPKDQAHKAWNSVVQGGAADIVERQMVRLDEAFRNTDVKMLLQVHDSVVFDIPKNLQKDAHGTIREIMENVEDGKFGVRFAVDIHEWGS